MSSLYSETFLAYAKNPPNKYVMEDVTVRHFEENRSCGDSMEIFMKISDDNHILDASFEGNTAIVTTACASILAESIVGMNIRELFEMDSDTIHEMVGVEISPRRKQASVLGLIAFRNAAHEYLGDGITDDFSDVMR